MNQNLSEAIQKVARADMAISTFYAIWDYIKGVEEALNALEGDCRVVDAIYAAEDVRRQRTLTTE